MLKHYPLSSAAAVTRTGSESFILTFSSDCQKFRNLPMAFCGFGCFSCVSEAFRGCWWLEKATQIFRDKVADKHQPAQKLHEATVHAVRKAAIDPLMVNFTLADAVPAVARDRQITLGGRMAHIRIEFIALTNKFSMLGH
ncbi:hypothetical protein B0J14DRAFT_605394 [Halenospora varia]|nr:hypothetical protein B0J14DRAFT_605394 [Halenospora varia]